MPEPLSCRRCGRPVVAGAGTADIFEGMHYVCFHYQFEHRGDPDASCGTGCVSEARDRGAVVAMLRALADEATPAPPAAWAHQDLPGFLLALADWLEDGDRHYAERGRTMPLNGYDVLTDGLRAAPHRVL